MMIYNAVVCPMDKPQIPNGFVAWDSGGITQVGDMSQCPAPVPDQDVDAQGGYVLPGFVDVHCHLGLLADGLSYDEDDCNEVSDPCTPQLRAIDALYPLDHHRPHQSRQRQRHWRPDRRHQDGGALGG